MATFPGDGEMEMIVNHLVEGGEIKQTWDTEHWGNDYISRKGGFVGLKRQREYAENESDGWEWSKTAWEWTDNGETAVLSPSWFIHGEPNNLEGDNCMEIDERRGSNGEIEVGKYSPLCFYEIFEIV